MKKLNFLASILLLGLVLCNTGCSSKKEVIEPEVGVLINGVTWATRNINAPGYFTAKPEDPGMFYQWNRKVGWSTTGNSPTSSPAGQTWNSTGDTGSSWTAENDPCPPGWQVPSEAQLQSLFNKFDRFDKFNDVSGGYFKDGTNEIFLPAAGCRNNDNCNLQEVGIWGYYYSNSNWVSMGFVDLGTDGGQAHSGIGMSIRCVKK